MRIVVILTICCSLLVIIPWLISWPVKLFTSIVIKIRQNRYDPEKITCKGCGYRGDERSKFKTVELHFRRTRGREKAAIECVCFRCGAIDYLPLRIPAEKWLADMPVEELKNTL